MVAPLRFVLLRVYPILVTGSEMPSGTSKKWIDRVAQFRRSRSGLISAITTWLHLGDLKVARFRRSQIGTIAPINNIAAFFAFNSACDGDRVAIYTFVE